MTVNTKFRDARKSKKFTMKNLANLVNVSSQSISNYENNICNPSQDIFKKLKEHLDLSEAYADYFEFKKYKRYNKDSICVMGGCKDKPVAKDVCMKHYMALRTTKEKQQ